jgi:hypothetical protein
MSLLFFAVSFLRAAIKTAPLHVIQITFSRGSRERS